MEVLYHGMKTRYAYDFPLCFPHELLMSLRTGGKDLHTLFSESFRSLLHGRLEDENSLGYLSRLHETPFLLKLS